MKIRCCHGCTERRIRCHVWGECVHYMNEKYLSEEQRKAALVRNQAEYYPTSAFAENSRNYWAEKYRKGQK